MILPTTLTLDVVGPSVVNMRDDSSRVGQARPGTGMIAGVRGPKTHARRIGTLRKVGGAELGAAWERFIRAGRRLERRFRAGVSGVRLLSMMRR